MTKEIDWTKLTRDDFYILSGDDNASKHNVWVRNHGYLTDYVKPDDRRDDPKEHWDPQYQNSEAFREAWKPRPGLSELVFKLAQKQTGTYKVLNLGAGLGDFTCDLARIPNAQVTHVDFSEQANNVAQKRIDKFGLSNRVQVITETNLSHLKKLKEQNQQADFIFFYGSLGENTPLEDDIKVTLEAAAAVLKPGGRLWYVGLEQPFLSGEGDTHVTDIIGEWPTRPGFISEALAGSGMVAVKEETGDRPDNHPLKAGGVPEDHFHSAYRSLWVKPEEDGSIPVTPEFGFKEAVDPQWQETWQQLISA